MEIILVLLVNLKTHKSLLYLILESLAGFEVENGDTAEECLC
jgi:hypothetical protein